MVRERGTEGERGWLPLAAVAGLVLVAVAPLAAGGCADRNVYVIKQAQPNPLVGHRGFAVEPVRFESLKIGRSKATYWLMNRTPEQQASFAADQQDSSSLFVEQLTDSDLDVAPGTVGDAPFVIRPFYTKFRGCPPVPSGPCWAKASMTVRILDASGKLVDRVAFNTEIRVTLFNPSSGQQIRQGAKAIAGMFLRYLRGRVAR